MARKRTSAAIHAKPPMSSSKRYGPRPRDAATLTERPMVTRDVENDSCLFAFKARPVWPSVARVMTAKIIVVIAPAVRRVDCGAARNVEAADAEPEKQEADRDPCITNMQDQDERITQSPAFRPSATVEGAGGQQRGLASSRSADCREAPAKTEGK